MDLVLTDAEYGKVNASALDQPRLYSLVLDCRDKRYSNGRFWLGPVLPERICAFGTPSLPAPWPQPKSLRHSIVYFCDQALVSDLTRGGAFKTWFNPLNEAVEPVLLAVFVDTGASGFAISYLNATGECDQADLGLIAADYTGTFTVAGRK